MIKLPVQFAVTGADIKAGERQSPKRDPVALALARQCAARSVEAYPDILYVKVPVRTLRGTRWRWYMAETPPVTSLFMEAFDSSGALLVRPFSFTVAGWVRSKQNPWARDVDWLMNA